MDAVCVLFGIAPSWKASKKFLAETATLQKLMTYDKDNVDVSLFVSFKLICLACGVLVSEILVC
jgi:hypothetical protein